MKQIRFKNKIIYFDECSICPFYEYQTSICKATYPINKKLSDTYPKWATLEQISEKTGKWEDYPIPDWCPLEDV